jgi:hypothetical protein
LEYQVPEELRSKNEVIQHLYKTVYAAKVEQPLAREIVDAALDILNDGKR